MIKFYRTDDRKIHEEGGIVPGGWIDMVNPTVAEGELIAKRLQIDIQDLLAALDEEESSRVELEDGYTLILVDIPTIEIRHDKEAYTTIPLGIILTQDIIITICTEETPVLQAFVNGRVKEFSTKKKCVLCIRSCSVWLRYIRMTFVSLIRNEPRLRNALMMIPKT